MTLFRHYNPDECHPKTGYPYAWEGKPVPQENLLLPSEWEPHPPIKDIVREAAGHRCIRCGHPYRKGEHGNGEWSSCDGSCTHKGPARMRAVVYQDWDDWVGWYEGEIGDDVADIPPGSFDIQAKWRILTVHHLDNVKANCRWWNLAALCQRCHLQIQGTVQMSRVWPWEHTAWFRPYVAGYYAWAYLDEDLDRSSVVARLDELLALEQLA